MRRWSSDQMHVSAGGQSHVAWLSRSICSWSSRIVKFSRLPLALKRDFCFTSPRNKPASSRIPVRQLVPLLCMPITKMGVPRRMRGNVSDYRWDFKCADCVRLIRLKKPECVHRDGRFYVLSDHFESWCNSLSPRLKIDLRGQAAEAITIEASRYLRRGSGEHREYGSVSTRARSGSLIRLLTDSRLCSFVAGRPWY